MNELEYINATNLAKLRVAWTVLHDVLPTREEEKDFDAILAEIRKYVVKYEHLVKVRT